MMEYKGFTGKAEFDLDAELLHGEILGIRDVVTFQATSVHELRAAFRESVDDYLAFCKKRSEQPDKPLSGKFLVRLDSRLHRKIDLAAAASGMSLNSFVANCLDKAVATGAARNISRKVASSQPTTSKRTGSPTKRSHRRSRGKAKAA